MSLLRALLLGSLLTAACSSTSSATPSGSSDKVCTPGAYVYCRCQNRDEGTKLCQDDGKGFDACLPCESDSNPEDTSYQGPYVPSTPNDAGTTAGKCGDKIVTEGEACDDGNTNETDGCDSSCKLAGTDVLSSRSCPGMPVHVFGAAVQFTTTTVGAPNTTSVQTGCPSAGAVATTGASAADRIFSVTAHKTGTLEVSTTDTTFDNWIYIVAGDCTAGVQASYLVCANKTAGTGGETASTPVEAGKTYSVVVDGVVNAQGAFRITMEID